MITVEEKTTIVGLTELRKMISYILKRVKSNKVILTRRNKPVGVIVDYEEYKKMEEIIDTFEDYVLGHLARERAQRKGKKWIILEETEKRLGLK
ncbi:MAG: type II toxin-antitoxin system Phd/YefM family antitoxin [Candidatus Aminicenantes bacterium]|nr:type II toxin-antitoxin system Phd/YefM family antitoxin [Candidatus Aminicenantes bacterium]MDH5384167.1 type II toxin-antitoxin system Phd/YefM family antitoxin [Candidatus Aminicenantes bacterium]